MIYILEGNEGAGKSVLAEMLAKTTGAIIRHRSKPKNKKEKELMMFMYLEDIANSEHQHVIWDRCFYSEIVYGNVMRDASVISESQMYVLEKFMKCNGGAIVYYCSSPIMQQWKRAQDRGEEYIKEFSDFEKIYNAYEDLFKNTKHLIPVVNYSIENNAGLLTV